MSKVIKSYKFRAYPQIKKVERSIKEQSKLHSRLYNEAKEQRDNNYIEIRKAIIENAQTLINREDSRKSELQQLIDNENLKDEINNDYAKIRYIWDNDKSPQKTKQIKVNEIKKEISFKKKKIINTKNTRKYIEIKTKEDSSLKRIPNHITFYDQYSLIKNNRNRYKEGYASSLQMTLSRLDDAYKAFFERCKKGETPGFPKWKSWKLWDTFVYRQSGFEFKDGRLKLSRIGWFRLKLHREYEGKIKTVTLTKECGKYYVILSCEQEKESVQSYIDEQREIGIDLGLHNYIALSDGSTYDYPFFLKESLRDLRILGRKMSRQVKGSKRRGRTKEDIRRSHFSIKNKRNNYIYNLVHELAQKFDVFYLEDLNIKNMLEQKYINGGKHLRRNISDSGWNSFIIKLENKCYELGKKVVKIKPEYTSQTCRVCGEIKMGNEKLTLKDRNFVCKKCGHTEDRDINAAKNILEKGRKVLLDKALETIRV